MRDELECGCRASARARIVTLESTATTRPRKGNKRDHGFAKSLMQWRNNLKRISRSWRRLKKKEGGRCEEDTQDCGLIRSCAPRPGKRKWSTSVATRCTQLSPEKRAYVKREGQPSRQDRQGNQESPTCARGGSRRGTRRTQDQNCTRRLHLEALKVVLSEIATGKRGGKVVALIDVRGAYFCAPARRTVFVELPPEQPGDEHMSGLLQYSLYGTRRRRTKLGGGPRVNAQ